MNKTRFLKNYLLSLLLLFLIFGCTWSLLLPPAFSSCGKQGLLFFVASLYSGFSCCKAQFLDKQVSVVAECQLIFVAQSSYSMDSELVVHRLSYSVE